jgi:tripartite-type tricarboxylate transporter receptor subunit TctC
VDVTVRVIAQQLTNEVRQPIIVDNRAGAGGNIAAAYVAKAPADGYTVFLGTTGNLAVNKALYGNLPYDPVRDFAGVTTAYRTWNILIVPTQSKLMSVQDLIAEARAHPGKLSFGSPGNGTIGHLVGAYFKQLSGTDLLHIPYKGQNLVLQDLLAGNIQLSFESNASAIPLIRGGKVRALAVTSSTRLPDLPDVPAFGELGMPELDLQGWAVFVVPVATPEAIVQQLNRALVSSLAAAPVTEKLTAMGVRIRTSTIAEAQRNLVGEAERWARIVAASGAKVE